MNEFENDELQRKDIDNYYRRNKSKDSYKNRHFDGKRTGKDEYSGDTVYYSEKGQNNQTGKRHYTTSTTANVDHVKPIEKIKKQYDRDVQSGKLTKQQVKKMANADYNLAVTSEKRNKEKLGKSNIDHLLNQIKKGEPEDFNTSFNMVKKEVSSNAAMTVEAEGYKISNKVKNRTRKAKTENVVSQTAHSVAVGTEAAFMSATVSTVNNIVLVATKEKTVTDAKKDIAIDVGESFVEGAGLDVVQFLAREQAKKSKNELVREILSKDLPIQQISTAVMIGGSVIRYINDDISAEECMTEIILNGVGSVAYSMGMALGGPAGAIISTIVVSQINRIVLEYQNANQLNEAQNKRVLKLKSEAMREIGKQQKDFEAAVEKMGCWDNVIKEGFEEMMHSACEDSYDLQGVTNGLDKILSAYGKQVKFKTLEEYEGQLDKPLLLNF